MVDKALQLATQAHAGQRDKGGAPYIWHPIAVAEQVKSDDAKTVALLHDVVEDTAITLEQLASEGFSAEVVEAVRVMTRVESEPYERYLAQIKHNVLACEVKLADLHHNMDLRRLNGLPTDADEKRLQKYQWAEQYLKS